MNNFEDMKSEILRLQARVAELEEEVEELTQELHETSQGTLALYNEIDLKNEQLKANKEELENKNLVLAETMDELKASEEARIESVRTAAIGSVVVTYNHEINNPLAIIQGNLDLLAFKRDSIHADVEEKLEIIRKASERIKDVTTKIQQYKNLLTTGYLDLEMLDLDSKEREYGENSVQNPRDE